MVQFLNGHLKAELFWPDFKWLKQDGGPKMVRYLVGWSVPAEIKDFKINQLKTRLVRF
jgi:hypothetical protein